MPNLEFETTRNGTVAVVAPTGELDLSGAAVLEAELDRLADDPELATVVLDLRGLEFMDSSGLRLVVVGRHAGARGGPAVRADPRRRDRAPRVRDHPHERPAGLRRRRRRTPMRSSAGCPSPEAAAEARHALDDLGELPDGRMRDVRLLVSELVTNAVRHANLATATSSSWWSSSPTTPCASRSTTPAAASCRPPRRPTRRGRPGWGLYLVAELADRWGVDSDERTLVWFELDPRGGRPSGPLG